MRQNLQLAGVMASILGFMAVAGLTIGARFQSAPAVPIAAESQPIAAPAPKSARRVRTPKVEVRLTYDGVSLNSSEGADDSASPSVAVSEPTEHSVSDAACCQSLPVDEPAAHAENSGFANLGLPYFTPVDGK